MLQAIKNLFAFLTIFPFKMDEKCLDDSAKLLVFFPIVGALLGLVAGVFSWVFLFFLPALVVGALALGLLLLLTGLHHTDGLLDFGDAIMCHGSSEKKIEVLHDQLTGAGAIGLGITTYIVTALGFSSLNSIIIIQSLIVVELCAKLSMVVGSWAGKAVHTGMNTSFLNIMDGKSGTLRLIAAIGLSILISIPLLGLAGLAAVFSALLTGLILVFVSHSHFKGVTGDVLGATNELSRMTTIIVVLAMI